MELTKRKRVANFTIHEKALLTKLVRTKPIILLTKLTDGASILEKKNAWNTITREFNRNPHVQMRDQPTLKRAWDNLKALTRKAKVNNSHSKDGPPSSPHTSQEEALNMVDEVAAAIGCEVDNDNNGPTSSCVTDQRTSPSTNQASDNESIKQSSPSKKHYFTYNFEPDDTNDDCVNSNPIGSSHGDTNHNMGHITTGYQHRAQKKPSDYIRREAIIRIKCLQAKQTAQMAILKSKLETQEIKKRAAELEEQTNQLRLRKAKQDLDNMMGRYLNKLSK